MNPNLRTDPTTNEQEKFCHQCREWWPATTEFFNRSTKGYLRSPCKACIDEKRRKSIDKPCCVPGCKNPRYHWRYSRCYEHRLWAVKR